MRSKSFEIVKQQALRTALATAIVSLLTAVTFTLAFVYLPMYRGWISPTFPVLAAVVLLALHVRTAMKSGNTWGILGHVIFHYLIASVLVLALTLSIVIPLFAGNAPKKSRKEALYDSFFYYVLAVTLLLFAVLSYVAARDVHNYYRCMDEVDVPSVPFSVITKPNTIAPA